MRMSRWRATYPHWRPFQSLLGLGTLIPLLVSLAVLTLFARERNLQPGQARQSDYSLLQDPEVHIPLLCIAAFAFLSLIISWYVTGMAKNPSARRALGTVFFAFFLAALGVSVMIPVFFLRPFIAPDNTLIEVVTTAFILSISASLILIGPIAFPIGWYIGRWAQRLHQQANDPEAFAEHFT